MMVPRAMSDSLQSEFQYVVFSQSLWTVFEVNLQIVRLGKRSQFPVHGLCQVLNLFKVDPSFFGQAKYSP